jgi:hypothetical protein
MQIEPDNSWAEETKEGSGSEEVQLQPWMKFEAQSLVERQTTISSHEQIIRTHEALQASDLGGGVNRVEFVELKDDGSVIFKPIDGEVPIGKKTNAHIEVGTYYKRERAAYLVSEYFGFHLVPPTIIRELNGEIGSAQEFIPDAKPAYELLKRDRSSLLEKLNVVGKRRDKKYIDALNRLFIFDHLIWSLDRHPGNFLLKEGNIHAIDNGLAFNKKGDEEYLKWRAHMPGFQYTKVAPADIVARLQEFASRPEQEEDIRSQMEGLLSAEEIDALVYRAKEIAKKVSENAVIYDDLSDRNRAAGGKLDIKFNKDYEG